MFTATSVQVASYLFGVCLFSISFLVFLNSSVSFVVTDLLKQKDGVGNAVGTLGFADELVAILACPLWGVASDRIGVRTVCVLGYAIIGLALFLFVQARNVFPQLLLARLFFSIGGAASSTMVTAILPSMVCPRREQNSPSTSQDGHTASPSISSELTITQKRHHRSIAQRSNSSTASPQGQAPTRLAGFVGLFTGFGALVALVLFLPLPAAFRGRGVDSGAAVIYSYYIVGAVALAVAVIVLFGLRNLAGEEGKGLVNLVKTKSSKSGNSHALGRHSYAELIFGAVKLGFKSPTMALGYLGGFVARASSVGISLFIPLFVNAWFISSGMCDKLENNTGAGDSPAIDQCQRAYVVSAELTGVSQLAALVFAPVFGYLADRYPRFNAPLLVATLAGILGYLSFANLESPDPKAVTGGGLWVFLVVILLGISQIGAIVCSLGLLGRSVLESDNGSPRSDTEASTSNPMLNSNPSTGDESEATSDNPHPSRPVPQDGLDSDETSGLLAGQSTEVPFRQQLKGSIAGVYSLAGGAGILLLTKVGGHLFDKLSPSAPFYMLATFNGILLLFGVACGVSKLRVSE